MKYASLVGPLLGVYYPLPFEEEFKNREAMRTSRLKHLWHNIYSEAEVDAAIKEFGGIKLPICRLDYDSYDVHCAPYWIDIVFSALPPCAEFVDLQDHSGRSIKLGQWIARPAGFAALRILESPLGPTIVGLPPEVLR